MTGSITLRRYLVALLWHWSFPFFMGAMLGVGYATFTAVGVLNAGSDVVLGAISDAIHACQPAETTREEASQVRGRAPGLSEHASPFGQTEARAERTLDPPRPRTASAGEGGAAPPPRAPEPPAVRVG